MRTYELNPYFDRCKSFYNKATVRVTCTGDKILTSYQTDVARITAAGQVIVHDTYSKTTLRHIVEFLKQEGHRADNKSQILADYSA